MLWQFIVGGIVCVLNVAIHALVKTTAVRVAHREGSKKRANPSLFLIIVRTGGCSVR